MNCMSVLLEQKADPNAQDKEVSTLGLPAHEEMVFTANVCFEDMLFSPWITPASVLSDFIWQFFMPNIGVIPNQKTGCIFPIFVSIFPIKLKKNVCIFQSRPQHCAIGPFTGS